MKRLVLMLFLLLCAASPVQAQIVQDLVNHMVSFSPPQVETFDKTRRIHLVSDVVDVPFTGIAIQGFASGDSVSGWVQFPGDNWIPLYIVRSATDDAFLGAYRGASERRSVRFTLRFSIGPSDSLTLIGGGVFSNRAGDAAAPRTKNHEQAGNFRIVAPALVGRAAWGAAPFIGNPTPLNRPTYNDLTLHHTAGFSATTLAEGLEQVRRIQDFHQNGRGWRDIGYQFLMDQEGRLYQGRPFLNNAVAFEDGPPLAHGAHVGGRNTGNIGVSLMGCYHPPEGSGCRDAMTAAATDSLLVVFAYLSERYGVAPDAISGHRDFGATSCPGDNNYAMLPRIRTDTAELLVTGNASLGAAVLTARADDIGVVTLTWTFTANSGIETFTIERISGDVSVTVLSRSNAEDGHFVDSKIAGAGPVSYTLLARDRRGREQVLSVVEVSIDAPLAHSLAQNFPNPFAGSTTIRYILEQPGLVYVQVYDGAGRQVSSLERGWREAGLWHTITFDAHGLPGGVYYYRVLVEGFVDVTHQASQPLVIVR